MLLNFTAMASRYRYRSTRAISGWNNSLQVSSSEGAEVGVLSEKRIRATTMNIFQKLHNRVAPPGLETRLLKAMPAAAVASIVLPLLLAWVARLYVPGAGLDNTVKAIKSVDIFAWSLSATLLTAVLTVTIGCIVVWVMKGPAYVADAYPVSHANRPVRQSTAADDS